MSTTQVGLVILAIICFVTGIWPIGIAIIGLLIYVSKTQKPKETKREKTIEELERENEALRQELEAEQAVRRAMDKAEQREKKN